MGKRKSLQRLEGQRLEFTAVVDRFGTKGGWHGGKEETILLKEVFHGGKLVTDHLWFSRGRAFDGLQPGQRIRFRARATEYEKGYQGRRLDRMFDPDVPAPTTDWRLSRPTKVEAVGS